MHITTLAVYTSTACLQHGEYTRHFTTLTVYTSQHWQYTHQQHVYNMGNTHVISQHWQYTHQQHVYNMGNTIRHFTTLAIHTSFHNTGNIHINNMFTTWAIHTSFHDTGCIHINSMFTTWGIRKTAMSSQHWEQKHQHYLHSGNTHTNKIFTTTVSNPLRKRLKASQEPQEAGASCLYWYFFCSVFLHWEMYLYLSNVAYTGIFSVLFSCIEKRTFTFPMPPKGHSRAVTNK